MRESRKPITLRMKPDTYYIWCGGSCNYASKRRESAGAYIMEKDGKQVETYVVSDTDTTEFRMILNVMIHAMNTLPNGSDIVFMTNVSYIQNFDITPTEKSANADLIQECIAAKQHHNEVKVKICDCGCKEVTNILGLGINGIETSSSPRAIHHRILKRKCR